MNQQTIDQYANNLVILYVLKEQPPAPTYDGFPKLSREQRCELINRTLIDIMQWDRYQG